MYSLLILLLESEAVGAAPTEVGELFNIRLKVKHHEIQEWQLKYFMVIAVGLRIRMQVVYIE